MVTMNEQAKNRIQNIAIQGNKPVHLSAQYYATMTDKEKEALREVLTERGFDADEYERTMKRLWPREVGKKTVIWRHR